LCTHLQNLITVLSPCNIGIGIVRLQLQSLVIAPVSLIILPSPGVCHPLGDCLPGPACVDAGLESCTQWLHLHRHIIGREIEPVMAGASVHGQLGVQQRAVAVVYGRISKAFLSDWRMHT
jgi:hypothetical protein